jgi:hypothetical protein
MYQPAAYSRNITKLPTLAAAQQFLKTGKHDLSLNDPPITAISPEALVLVKSAAQRQGATLKS